MFAMDGARGGAGLPADTGVAVLMTDPHGAVIECSRDAAALFEIDADRIVGRSIDRLIPGSDVLIAAFRDDREPVVLVGLRAESGEFPLELALARSGDGTDSRILAMIRDVSRDVMPQT
jgi:PAS domain-containing protein